MAQYRIQKVAGDGIYRKEKKRYSVVYSYTDENGVKRQKWETFATNAEAKEGVGAGRI